MMDISVGRIAGLETMLGSNIYTTNITSLRQITQIYCAMHNITIADLSSSITAPDVLAWWMQFRELFSAADTATTINEKTKHTTLDGKDIRIRPLTIPLLIELEDAIGVPFYAPKPADLDAIATQMVCVRICYGLTDRQIAAVRDMPYPPYLRGIWMPLRAALLAALVPTPQEETREEQSAPKNQLPT